MKNDKGLKKMKDTKPNLIDTMLFEFAKKVSKKWDNDESKKLEKKELSDDIEITEDIFYTEGNLSSQSLDVYHAKNSKAELPIIIDIHGGGFVSGSKESDRLFCCELAKLGYVVFSINYTLVINGAKVFDNIDEVHKAVLWIIDNSKNYGGNKNEIYLCGHSAGGMLAAIEVMLSKNEKLCEVFGLQQSKIQFKGLILDCGFMKFYDNNLAYAMFRRVVFPQRYEKDDRYRGILFDKFENISDFPKTYIITNNKDELRNMSTYFYKLLKRYHVECRLEKAKIGGHVGIIYNPQTDENKNILKNMVDFFN